LTNATNDIHNHDHVHGAVDPTLLTTERGIWAVKWSMVGLLLTAFLQAAVVTFTSSVALLADTIHNPQLGRCSDRHSIMDCICDGA
jgi:Co/Zn/Cd efflux system component